MSKVYAFSTDLRIQGRQIRANISRCAGLYPVRGKDPSIVPVIILI